MDYHAIVEAKNDHENLLREIRSLKRQEKNQREKGFARIAHELKDRADRLLIEAKTLEKQTLNAGW